MGFMPCLSRDLRHLPAQVVCAAFCSLLVLTAPAMAAAPGNAAPGAAADVIVIRNDRGGLVSRRVREISEIRALGQRVEIRGRQCLSTCTMYLGLPGTCVSPRTSFGFHGPSNYGTRLSVADFEYWSRIIARHYPEPLQSWYLREGRNRLSGYLRISGARLIALGAVQPCAT